MASQITSLTIIYSTSYSGVDQRKHQSSASLAFVRGIHRGPVNSPHKRPVTRKMFPFCDVIMYHKQMPMVFQNTNRRPLTRPHRQVKGRPLWVSWRNFVMMTSSNGNIFCVTGPLCGEFTGHRGISLTKASDAELFFDLCLNKRLSKQSWGWWFETPSRSLWRHCNALLV